MSSFTRDTPVLEFTPRPHMSTKARMYFAWPAWAYRVVAPASDARNLNPFQRAVLGLAHAGINDRHKVSALLQLEAALVLHIQAELTEANLLNDLGYANEAGIAILNGDAEGALDDGRQVTGYVFQDAVTHQFWPRFAERLTYAEIQERGDRITVVRERDHREYRDDLYLELFQAPAPPPTPTPLDVVKANRDHQKMLKRLKRSRGEDATGEVIAPRELNRVQLIETQPRPVYLLSVLYYPDEEGVLQWSAADPFGAGQSPFLHRLVTSRLPHSERLQDAVKTFEAPQREHAAIDVLAWQLNNQRRALERVDLAFTQQVQNYPTFYQALVNAETALVELTESRLPRQLELEGALTALRKVVEGVFVTLRDTHPVAPVWHHLQNDDREYNAMVMTAAARATGLREPLPDPLYNVNARQVRGALNPAWDVKPTPLMAATILLAARNEAHPLRRAAAVNPEVIRQLDNVYRKTSDASHYGEKVPLTVASIEALAADVRHAVALLLNLPEPATV